MKYIKKPIENIICDEDTSKYVNKYSRHYIGKMRTHDQAHRCIDLNYNIVLEDLTQVCIEYSYYINEVDFFRDGQSNKGNQSFVNVILTPVEPIEYDDIADYHLEHFTDYLKERSDLYKKQYNISEDCQVYKVHKMRLHGAHNQSVFFRVYFDIW